MGVVIQGGRWSCARRLPPASFITKPTHTVSLLNVCWQVSQLHLPQLARSLQPSRN
jgi:hypothetical protein